MDTAIKDALRLAKSKRRKRQGGGQLPDLGEQTPEMSTQTPPTPYVDVMEQAHPTTPTMDAAREAFNEAIPSPARLLTQHAFGVTSPITEKDFPQSDLNYMRNQVADTQRKNAETESYAREQEARSPAIVAEDYRDQLKMFDKTRGKTSVGYPQEVHEQNRGETQHALKFYNTGPAQTVESLTSPATRIATTLGRYNAYDTPKGRVVIDRYDFTPASDAARQVLKPYSPSTMIQTPLRSIRAGISDLRPGLERPVAINLDAKPNTSYTYTGRAITTPGSHGQEPTTPQTDAILASMAKQLPTTPSEYKEGHGATPMLSSLPEYPMPPRRPREFAHGGEVDDAMRIAHKSGGGAWTRKEGKNPEGGLNAKGRASAKREGMNLKPPAPHPKTEKDAARRKSFCARMSGMKAKLTSSKTANDPDSRINKSLRAWNCADGGAVDDALDLVQRKSGGKAVWNKPRPKGLGESKPLSSAQKSSAKARAKAAGRPYPNLIDNMAAARKGK